MPAVAKEQAYKATFERTEKKSVEGQSKVVTLSISDPDDASFQRLVDNGKFGYLRVTDSAGNKIHGLQVSALKARDVMKSCIAGKYNPFPKVRNKRRELGAE